MNIIDDRLGRKTCDVLKGIRLQIASQNNIPFETEICTYLGDCAGTCPKCEAELKYLESKLEELIHQGHSVQIECICTELGMLKTPKLQVSSVSEISENI